LWKSTTTTQEKKDKSIGLEMTQSSRVKGALAPIRGGSQAIRGMANVGGPSGPGKNQPRRAGTRGKKRSYTSEEVTEKPKIEKMTWDTK